MSIGDVVAAFERVRREPTDMIEHMDVIRSYSSQCESAVEFGVYDCTSTWALLAGCPKKLTSYDIDRRAEVSQVETAAQGSGTEFRFVLASSLEVEIEPCELLFIDSFHSYEQLKKELEIHADRVQKYILMHDTSTFGEVDQTGQGRGLWPAVMEFLLAHPNWSLAERRVNCHGLSVLKRTA